jgi:hypothetical protein
MQPALTAPMLVRPILLDIPEPTDAEIWAAAQASR